MRSELRREVFSRPTRQQSGRVRARSATAEPGVADVDGGAVDAEGDCDEVVDRARVGDGTARRGGRGCDDDESASSSASSHSDATFEVGASDERADRVSRKRSRSVPFTGRVVRTSICITMQCSAYTVTVVLYYTEVMSTLHLQRRLSRSLLT